MEAQIIDLAERRRERDARKQERTTYHVEARIAAMLFGFGGETA